MGLTDLGDASQQHGQESLSERTPKGGSCLGTCNDKAASYQELTVAEGGFPGLTNQAVSPWLKICLSGC